jgi:hypothetical protein
VDAVYSDKIAKSFDEVLYFDRKGSHKTAPIQIEKLAMQS